MSGARTPLCCAGSVREAANALLCIMGSRHCGLSPTEQAILKDCPADSIYVQLLNSSDSLALQLLLDLGFCAAVHSEQLRDLLKMAAERLPWVEEK